MATPIVDPSYQPVTHIFGFSLPGLATWGKTRWYYQQAIWGARPFGGEIPGKNQDDDVAAFIRGSKNPKSPYFYKGSWHTSASPWPVTPQMSARARGRWADRVIYYTKGGKQFIRRATPYHLAAKDYLVPWQLKFMEAAFVYSLFDDATKNVINADAKKINFKGHGREYFTKLYMKDDPRWQDYV